MEGEDKEHFPSWSCPLPELLEEISSRLSLLDYLTFRRVSKSWNKAPSRSVFSIPRNPLILFYGGGCNGGDDNTCYLYHYAYRRTTPRSTIQIPELANSICIASRGGWLLVHQRLGESVFFLTPFSNFPKKTIDLPPFPPELWRENIVGTFDSEPTDTQVLVLFAISNENFIKDSCQKLFAFLKIE